MLHPDCENLWQRPREQVREEDACWFYNKKQGYNQLAGFMKRISGQCQLTKQYNNHCIRVTGATILSKNKFDAHQIMAVTGHKSVQSLSVYERVSSQEKIEMGRAMTDALCESTATEANFTIEGDIVDFLKSLESQSEYTCAVQSSNQSSQSITSTTVKSMQCHRMIQPVQPPEASRAIPLPIFNNCVIHNLSVNYK